MSRYGQGKEHALKALGLIKQADDPAMYQTPEGFKPFGEAARITIGRQLVGQPGKAIAEFRNGTWRNPGSYIRQSFWNATPAPEGAGAMSRAWHKVTPALNYLPGALGLYAATHAPADQKGEAVGSAGGSLLGTALGMPFGLVGTTVGSLAGSHIGGAVGKMFDHKKPVPAYHAASYEPQQQ